ncbi:hypothetical protein GGX14DRAFT_577617 [Mycena pura]|uniref:Uncharacterized protein n=1 Tax=Mycena pura TaxID=153505 RepID=A0AAD6UVG7_9AGAR|nr:hypothetical protein GGX14DRAFT_577617 [Mycena pura]
MADSVSLDVDLKTLLNAIKSLPGSTQNGRRDGPLGKHLTPDLTKDDNPQPVFPTHEDGPYYVFNMRWERVFQKQPGDPDNKLEKRASMTADTVSVDVVCKEWLKSGLAEGVNYTDYIRIREE